MTTAAQLKGAVEHVVRILNGLLSREAAGKGIKYSLAGVRNQPL